MQPLPEGPLANDPRNTCIGCGPANPKGLKLAFARRGDAVVGVFRATANHEGWPERLHSGVLYTALLETANWTAYGLTGRVGVPVRTQPFETGGWAATGSTLHLAGHRVAGEPFTVAAEATLGGRMVGRMARAYEFLDAAAFAARMGYASVPAAFEGAFP
jgi:hypothetical protein